MWCYIIFIILLTYIMILFRKHWSVLKSTKRTHGRVLVTTCLRHQKSTLRKVEKSGRRSLTEDQERVKGIKKRICYENPAQQIVCCHYGRDCMDFWPMRGVAWTGLAGGILGWTVACHNMTSHVITCHHMSSHGITYHHM